MSASAKGARMPGERRKALFLCQNNACRSQMAEGFMNALRGADFEAYSAGAQPTEVHPLALKVMSEAGVDISAQRSKRIDELPQVHFDYVVTLCGGLDEACPYVPGESVRMHVPFPDPAAANGSPEELLNEFRSVRDMIKRFIQSFPEMPGR